MKTETQIAEENINKIIAFNEAYKDWNNKKLNEEARDEAEKFVDECTENDTDNHTITLLSKEHKASCQRFLEFLEVDFFIGQERFYLRQRQKPILQEKITDLKQAIKLYEDNGI